MPKHLKSLKRLSQAEVILAEPPLLENEPPHKRLARATHEHARITEELRQLKKDWADKNIRSQATRIPVSTAEITHNSTLRRELQSALLAAQTIIGQCNKELKQRKAPVPHRATNGSQPHKERPLLEHREFNAYFRLAAEAELESRLYAQIEKLTKSMLTDALRNDTEEP